MVLMNHAAAINRVLARFFSLTAHQVHGLNLRHPCTLRIRRMRIQLDSWRPTHFSAIRSRKTLLPVPAWKRWILRMGKAEIFRAPSGWIYESGWWKYIRTRRLSEEFAWGDIFRHPWRQTNDFEAGLRLRLHAYPQWQGRQGHILHQICVLLSSMQGDNMQNITTMAARWKLITTSASWILLKGKCFGVKFFLGVNCDGENQNASQNVRVYIPKSPT